MKEGYASQNDTCEKFLCFMKSFFDVGQTSLTRESGFFKCLSVFLHDSVML